MDVFSMLKQDHKKVAALLNRLEKTEEEDRDERETLFQELKTELDTHARLEETIFYPKLEEYEDLEEIVREGHEEHAVVKRLLSELESLSKDDEQWGAKLTVLKENVEHHVEEEEGEMFKKARKALEKEESQALTEELARAKGENVESPQRVKGKTSSKKKSARKATPRRPQASSKAKKAGRQRRSA